jgi:outer membrane protein assembly factor BamB
MLKCHFGGLLALLVATISFSAGADNSPKRTDWPQWRGPNRDAVSTETGLMHEWPQGGPKLLWSAKGLGRGFSSVSLAGDRIFTMGDRGNAQYLIALNRSNGKELWAARVGPSSNDGNYPGPRCTPTVDGDLAYALGAKGDLVCVQAATGKERWRKNLARDFGGHMMSGWGYSESPLIDGDKLICTPGGGQATLAALDKRTGKAVWRSRVPEGDGAGYSSAVVSEGAGVRHYVQLLGGGIVGVRAADGKFLWRYNRIANRVANIPTPIVHGDHVFCSTGYNAGSALLKLERDGDGVRADEVYYLPARDLQNHHGGMVLVGDYLYAGHGHKAGAPICVELKTGKIAWKERRSPGDGSAGVVYADGDLYFRYQDGTMALIEATPEAFKEKGSFQIPHVDSPSWPHPVVAGGKLYLREQDWLMCYDVKAH